MLYHLVQFILYSGKRSCLIDVCFNSFIRNIVQLNMLMYTIHIYDTHM